MSTTDVPGCMIGRRTAVEKWPPVAWPRAEEPVAQRHGAPSLHCSTLSSAPGSIEADWRNMLRLLRLSAQAGGVRW